MHTCYMYVYDIDAYTYALCSHANIALWILPEDTLCVSKCNETLVGSNAGAFEGARYTVRNIYLPRCLALWRALIDITSRNSLTTLYLNYIARGSSKSKSERKASPVKLNTRTVRTTKRQTSWNRFWYIRGYRFCESSLTSFSFFLSLLLFPKPSSQATNQDVCGRFVVRENASLQSG